VWTLAGQHPLPVFATADVDRVEQTLRLLDAVKMLDVVGRDPILDGAKTALNKMWT
jgi:hypothetical protein